MDVVLMVVVVLLILAIPISAFVRLVAAFFSSEVRSSISRHPVLHIVWLTAAAFVLVLISSPLRFHPDLSYRHSRAGMVTRTLVTAMRSYQTEYERWPLQSSTNEDHAYQMDYKQLVEELNGNNPRKILFFDYQAKDVDKNGPAS